jgi:hypothetical protein
MNDDCMLAIRMNQSSIIHHLLTLLFILLYYSINQIILEVNKEKNVVCLVCDHIIII